MPVGKWMWVFGMMGFLSFVKIANAEVPFSSPFWLPTGHLQTIYPALLISPEDVSYRRDRWELDDGDFIDVDWVNADAAVSDNQPTVVLFHGLEGSSQSHYSKALMAEVSAKGWRGVVIHFRGCSGEPNRLPRAYYAGDTAEIEMMLTRVKSEVGSSPIYAVGVSLGGNALLKWLGEEGAHAEQLVVKAAAVSAPMDLGASANTLDSGLDRWLYTPMFVKSMKVKALAKAEQFPDILDVEKIQNASTIHEIDRDVTAVLHGFKDEVDYYAKNAAKPWLPQITVPTLIINAKNDPFVPAQSLPSAAEVSPAVTLEYPEEGGHVGFVHAPFPGYIDWLPKHLLSFFMGE